MSTKIHNSAKEKRYYYIYIRRQRERRRGVKILDKNIPEKIGLEVTVFVYFIRYLDTMLESAKLSRS